MIRYKDLSIRKKLVYLYGTLVILLVGLNFIFFHIAINSYKENMIASTKLVNDQVINNLEAFFSNLSKTTNIPYYDYNRNNTIAKKYNGISSNQLDKVNELDYSDTYDFFNKLFSIYNYLESIYMYQFDDGVVFREGYNYYKDSRYMLEEEEWYDKVITANGEEVFIGIHENEQLYPEGAPVVSVARLLKKTYTNDHVGIIVINMYPDKLDQIVKQVNTAFNLHHMIIDENNRVIYSDNENLIGEAVDHNLVNKGYSSVNYEKVNYQGEDSILIYGESKYTGWQVVSVIAEDELFKDINSVLLLILWVDVILVAIGMLSALLIAQSFYSPIKTLDTSMRLVEEGDFKAFVENDSQDEIGHLSQTFNHMIQQVESLIEQRTNEAEEKRVAELNALQSQINPHFMYNTLNVIKWMAKMQGAENITQSLDQFIHLLNFCAKTKVEFITIGEEIRFIESYVGLLRLRYYNRFDIIVDIDEKIYDYYMIKFLLQPFVENAIFHGLTGSNNNYYLKIIADLMEDAIVFKVIDNGIGIDEYTVEDIMKGEHKQKSMNAIGIRNVLDRIKLHHGDNYGVKIESILGEGTAITIRIPIIKNVVDEE
ncbi:cache domain-containing sensor histidine kinase [Vallitalea okinawensis]|uniref:cache domain-containing sensor histidine kinase n=1 Tax=Vallitalea okinawensis TaxID=2078660 RepID=UPI000CFB6721|nr:sensor histidine kinase [Vallitalea okinawensis]